MSIPCCWTLLLTGFLLLGDTRGQLATTTIDCITPAPFVFESTNEGNGGALERVQIPQDATFTLESPTCPYCLSILSIDHTPGAPFAVVVANLHLDFEALVEYNGVVTYSIVCMASGVTNNRTLPLKDLNDNVPVFEETSYSSPISKFLPVGRVVVRVKAIDADASPEFNTITYSTLEWRGDSRPPSDTFDVTSDGSVVLIKQLSLSNITQYKFFVIAKDIDGLSDSTIVVFDVIDRPSFEYTHYNASVSKNKVGPIDNMYPAPINANGGNASIVYHILRMSPTTFEGKFAINDKSGILTIKERLHPDCPFYIFQLVAQAENGGNDSTRVAIVVDTANNPPEFNQQLYKVNILGLVQSGDSVLVVKATDPDIGETEMLLYSLVEPSSLFDIEPSSGRVYAVTDVHPGTSTFSVMATDPHVLNDTTRVELIITDSSDVVQISINKPSDTVENKLQAMEKALERALGYNVTIVQVESSSSGTIVSFIAKETSGNIISPEDVKNDLKQNMDKVQSELQEVFGPDTDFDIVEGKGSGIIIIAIVLGIIIPLTMIAGMIAAVIRRRKQNAKLNPIEPTNERSRSQESRERMPHFNIGNPAKQKKMQRMKFQHGSNKMNQNSNRHPIQPTIERSGSQDSRERMPHFNIGNPAKQKKMQRKKFQHGPYQMNQDGNPNPMQPTSERSGSQESRERMPHFNIGNPAVQKKMQRIKSQHGSNKMNQDGNPNPIQPTN